MLADASQPLRLIKIPASHLSLAKKTFNFTVGFAATAERKTHNCFRLKSGAR